MPFGLYVLTRGTPGIKLFLGPRAQRLYHLLGLLIAIPLGEILDAVESIETEFYCGTKAKACEPVLDLLGTGIHDDHLDRPSRERLDDYPAGNVVLWRHGIADDDQTPGP
jgi:hypothetical protein